jgi:hypothetical protein
VVDFGCTLAALVGFLITAAAAKLVALALTLWGFAVRFVPCPGARKPRGGFATLDKTAQFVHPPSRKLAGFHGMRYHSGRLSFPVSEQASAIILQNIGGLRLLLPANRGSQTILDRFCDTQLFKV